MPSMEFKELYELNGIPWNSLEFQGIRWNSLGFHGIPCVEFQGIPKNSMEFHGLPCNAIAFHGSSSWRSRSSSSWPRKKKILFLSKRNFFILAKRIFFLANKKIFFLTKRKTNQTSPSVIQHEKQVPGPAWTFLDPERRPQTKQKTRKRLEQSQNFIENVTGRAA